MAKTIYIYIYWRMGTYILEDGYVGVSVTMDEGKQRRVSWGISKATTACINVQIGASQSMRLKLETTDK